MAEAVMSLNREERRIPMTPWQKKLRYLNNINLFSGLSQTELGEIARITKIQEIKKRQPIYLPGDPSNSVFLLKKGRVKISSSSVTGKAVTFEILEPGDIFGELDALEGSPREMAAEALDDVVICALSRQDFERCLQRHPDLTLRLNKLIGFKFRRLESRIEDLVCRDVPARLAHLLLDLAKTAGSAQDPGIRLRSKLTHHEMGNFIGCARETVTTILGQFRDDSLIKMDGRSITILNPSALQALSSQHRTVLSLPT
ncbi:MAG: Crp/Fnr family transcriptional regulator [Nitrospira sp.]|nr:MAG: Crp/Fnr family transcriptional regulator [Nitrospira sp.]